MRQCEASFCKHGSSEKDFVISQVRAAGVLDKAQFSKERTTRRDAGLRNWSLERA